MFYIFLWIAFFQPKADHRKHLAISAGNISKSLAGLSGCENNKDLSGALAKLSDVQRTMETIHTKQVKKFL
jgi:hypothetical protein